MEALTVAQVILGVLLVSILVFQAVILVQARKRDREFGVRVRGIVADMLRDRDSAARFGAAVIEANKRIRATRGFTKLAADGLVGNFVRGEIAKEPTLERQTADIATGLTGGYIRDGDIRHGDVKGGHIALAPDTDTEAGGVTTSYSQGNVQDDR